MASSSKSGVPPGFRFHPTEEELLHYYLRKKVAMERIDLEVIREMDLNKVEPWELQEKCAIGSALQNEWYFFSRRDRKYPTGLRMNRATAAGFWKATGRDKCMSHGETMGMRKTLVFYRGRAPHGRKTDWIMHEYRLHGDNTEDGWVVCCVFKKKVLFKDATMESSGLYVAHDIPNTVATAAKAAAVAAENRRMGGVFYKHGFSFHPQLYSSLSVGDGFSIATGEFTMMDDAAANARRSTAPAHSVGQIHRHSPGEMEPCGWGWGKKSSF